MTYDASRKKVVLITQTEVWELGAAASAPSLMANRNTLSVRFGGAVQFDLDAGKARATLTIPPMMGIGPRQS